MSAIAKPLDLAAAARDLVAALDAVAPPRATPAPAPVLQPKRPTRGRARPAAVPAAHPAAEVATTAGAPIDLSSPNARRQLAERYPAPTSDRMVEASPDDDDAARAYLQASDAIRQWEGAKERAAALLCNTIRADLGVEGDDWIATWASRAGSINVPALLGELRALVPDLETIVARHRSAAGRTILVKRTGAEGER